MNGPGNGEFRVVGVDLGAQPGKTAYSEIVVRERTAEVTRSETDVSDEGLLDVFPGAARVGIDAPFGWPISFVSALGVHSLSNRWPDDDPTVYPAHSINRYRHLKYRITDLHVWEQVCRPLSVATDFISHIAIRNAGLLARAQSQRKLKVDRSGMTGHLVEVYPAAALKRWAVNGTALSQTVRHVGLDISDQVANRLAESEHALDALAAALVALMVAIELERDSEPDQGFIEPIPVGMEAVAKREGWIALPKTCSLTRLRHWLSERGRPARTAR